MDEPTTPTPPTPPENKPPFIAGLPDTPLERPDGYDGPLVCPFYGPDHPARQDVESKEAFNEDVARVAFGDAEIDRLKCRQGNPCFCGDWWVLARLHFDIPGFSSPVRVREKTGSRPWFLGWNSEHNRRTRTGIYSHLEGAMLIMAVLNGIDLLKAHLEHADLTLAHLQDASLFFIHLENAVLHLAHLERAQMPGARLQGANLTQAHCQHIECSSARFDSANLLAAEFQSAQLNLAQFHHARFAAADLDSADFRGAVDMLFDNNAEKRLNVEGSSSARWPTLRRTYSGPMFFVHLLLLVTFILPYAAKVLTLTTTARGYDALRESLGVAEGVPPGGEVVRIWLAHFDASHTDTHAWWVLLGGTHAWWPLMVLAALAIIGYNMLRGHLTLTIGVLRDQADRVERTPALEEYHGPCHPLAGDDSGWKRMPRVWWRCVRHCWFLQGIPPYRFPFKQAKYMNPLAVVGPWHLHQLARILFWISIASVALHVGSWLLTTTVPVPK